MKKTTAKKTPVISLEKTALERVVTVIDSFSRDFENTSKELAGNAEKTSQYLSYIDLKLADEEILVKPKLVRKFLYEVLGYSESDFIPEIRNKNNRKPDLSMANKKLHPFAFEIKGMDSNDDDLHDEWVNKGNLYVQDDPEVRFLIITNMREFRVYGADVGEDDRFSFLNNLSFDLPEIYKWQNQNSKKDETTPTSVKAFNAFCDVFHSKESSMTIDQKLEDIFQAPPERPQRLKPSEIASEKKNIREDLFATIEGFMNDLRLNHKSSVASFYAKDNESKKLLDLELGEISCSLAGKVSNFESESDLISKGKSILKDFFSNGSSASAEMDLFFRRIAYFTAFKLLLIRSWEDAEFISREEWTLYDGGFKKWYHQSNKNIKSVLESAYGIAKNRYEWLFKDNNNSYSWYNPSDEFAIDALWRLSKHNYATLNNDILGSVYEEHLNRSAKKKIGLFYTHPLVVNLMWDICEYNKEDVIFNNVVNGKKIERAVKRIFDPCMGSGSFLCEAIQRVLQCAGIYNGKHGDLKELKLLKEQILKSFVGVEIDPFAFFIAEINVLLMLTPLVKLIEEKSRGKSISRESFATGLIPHDSLYFYRNEEPNWHVSTEKANKNEKQPERNYRVTNENLIFGRKKDVANELFSGMKAGTEFGFDFTVSNPPYVGEKEAKSLFDSVKASNHDLSYIYQGKMDYLYWFIMLGLSKLKPGGKLCFITTAYWPTADGAEKLRNVIMDNGALRTVIDFGNQKLFEHAPGQHNMIFVIEKTDGKLKNKVEWEKNVTKIVEVKPNAKIKATSPDERIHKLVKEISSNFEKDSFENEILRVYTSGKLHIDLVTKSWNLKCTVPEVDLLTKLSKNCSTIATEYTEPKVGVQTTSDSVDKAIKKKYFSNDNKISVGDGIFVLSKAEVDDKGLGKNKFIKPIIKSSDIKSFVNLSDDDQSLIYTHRNSSPESDSAIMKHLNAFKPFLKNRTSSEPWWSNHRARRGTKNEKGIEFDGPNLVIPYRSIWNSGVALSGPVYGLTEVRFISDKNLGKLKALEAILNSDFAHFWFSIEGKHKGSMIEFLDFGHFPVPKLSEVDIKMLSAAADKCRRSFGEIGKLGVCPRTAVHFGVDANLCDPIKLLKSDAYTLKRFQTQGLTIQDKFPDQSATLKSVSIKGDSINLSFTGKGSKIKLEIGKLDKEDFKMIAGWIERYGINESWLTIYTSLAFPKNSKILEKLIEEFIKMSARIVKQATSDYVDLNDNVAEVFKLNAKEKKVISNRVQLRIDALRLAEGVIGEDSSELGESA